MATKNFALSTIAYPPSPPNSGTTLGINTGDGVLFPATPFNATVWPQGVQPTVHNAEIVTVTNVTVDEFTIVRGAEGTTPQNIAVAWQIAQNVTSGLLTQLTTMGGDVSGSTNLATVTGLQGQAITSNAANIVTNLANATVRSASATVLPCEQTAFTGSTAGQTLTLPTAPVVSTTYEIVNLASVPVTLAPGGTDVLNIFGTVGSATLATNETLGLVYSAGIWYCLNSNILTNSVGTLALLNGGTGATTASGALSNLSGATVNAGDLAGTGGTSAVPRVSGVQGQAISANAANVASNLANTASRTASATVAAGEQTIFTGSTTGQIMTLPASPVVGSIYTIVNLATVSVTVAAGTGNTINTFGTVGSVTVAAKESVQFVYYPTVWYCIDSNVLTNAVGTLPVANGGLNTSTAPAVGGIPVATSTSVYSPLTIGAGGQQLTSNSTTATWQAFPGAKPPSMNTLKAWTMDPAQVSTTGTFSNANTYYTAVWLQAGVTYSTVYAFVGTAGTGSTITFGLYNSTTQVAVTAATATTATGQISANFTTAYKPTSSGLYWIAFVQSGTVPALYEITNAIVNVGPATPTANTLNLRTSYIAATTLPGTIAGTPTAQTSTCWLALN